MQGTPLGEQPPGPPSAERPGDRKDHGTLGWDILMAVNLGALGLFAAEGLLRSLQAILGLREAEVPEVTGRSLWVQNAFNLLLMGIIPLLWVAGTRRSPWRGALAYLRMHSPLRGVLAGTGIGVAMLLALVPVMLLAFLLDPSLTENPVVEGIGGVLDWPLVFAIAAVAAVSEEILFRGILQRWVGLWGQAVLFALLHASYGTVLQLLLPFAIGLLFGYLVRRGWGLWVPIAAHFTFNFVQLALLRAGVA